MLELLGMLLLQAWGLFLFGACAWGICYGVGLFWTGLMADMGDEKAKKWFRENTRSGPPGVDIQGKP